MCQHSQVLALASFFAVAGGLAFAVISTMWILPYTYTSNFEEAVCTVEQSDLATNTCCHSVFSYADVSPCPDYEKYPCLEIVVSYVVTSSSAQTTGAVLQDNYETIAFQKKSECSYFHCHPQMDYQTEYQNVKTFQEEYGQIGQNFACYYNPSNPSEVVLWRISLIVLVNALLWPGLALVVGSVFAVLAYKEKLPCLAKIYHDDEVSALTKNDVIEHVVNDVRDAEEGKADHRTKTPPPKANGTKLRSSKNENPETDNIQTGDNWATPVNGKPQDNAVYYDTDDDEAKSGTSRDVVNEEVMSEADVTKFLEEESHKIEQTTPGESES